MTTEQVIALADRKAREIGIRWLVDDIGYIRTIGEDRCPLEVAAGTPAQRSSKAAVALGIAYYGATATAIIGAADNGPGHDEVRALMLATFDFAEGDRA